MTIDLADIERLMQQQSALIDAQKVELAALRERLDRLERGGTGSDRAPSDGASSDDAAADDLDARPSRRKLLAMAGGAAAVAAVSTLGHATPAAAANNEQLLIAASRATSGGPAIATVLDYTPSTGRGPYFYVADSFAAYAASTLSLVGANDFNAAVMGLARSSTSRALTGVTGLSEVVGGTGVLGVASGSGAAYGVWGVSPTGDALVGTSSSGYSVLAAGSSRIGMNAHTPVGPPAAGTFAARDLIGDGLGNLWLCAVGGTPGVWRKLAGPGTAGAFHPITPQRVCDTRLSQPAPGSLSGGANRTISVADGRSQQTGEIVTPNLVPVGATAVTCNITVVNTVGVGFLAVNPGGVTEVSASTINWSAAELILANGITATLGQDRRLTIVAGGASTDFILDITGYYL